MALLKIEQPWGDHRLKMNGVFIGCVTKENADTIMALQRLAVVIEADNTQPDWRREEAKRLAAPNVEAQGRLTAASSPAGVPLERRVGHGEPQ